MLKSNYLQRWDREKNNWFRVILQIEYSVIPAVLPRVIVCSLFGLLVAYLYYLKFPVYLSSLSAIFPTLVLGLLLVFRTNTAYERFWEGRKLWGTLINTIRNLARTMWVTIAEKHPNDIITKIEALKLLVSFAVALKLHLRSEPLNKELALLITPARYEKLKNTNNPPLEIAFWIGDYLQHKYQQRCLDSYQLNSTYKLLDTMIDVLGGCERILKTPIPLAYAIHLKQLLLLYCLALPFQIVKELHWWTPLIVGIISLAVFGIEEIGIEIENPFGRDPNDLPLDAICHTIDNNINDLIGLEPVVRNWKNPSNN
jgi:putative membrane protein